MFIIDYDTLRKTYRYIPNSCKLIQYNVREDCPIEYAIPQEFFLAMAGVALSDHSIYNESCEKDDQLYLDCEAHFLTLFNLIRGRRGCVERIDESRLMHNVESTMLSLLYQFQTQSVRKFNKELYLHYQEWWEQSIDLWFELGGHTIRERAESMYWVFARTLVDFLCDYDDNKNDYFKP